MEHLNNCRCSLEFNVVGGHICKLIGGPGNGLTLWLPQLSAKVEIAIPIKADGVIGRMKRGESVEEVMSDNRCWYTLMPFSTPDQHFVYMALDSDMDL